MNAHPEDSFEFAKESSLKVLLRIIPIILGATLLVLSLCAVAAISAPDEGNMLTNPGFEDPDPANWDKVGGFLLLCSHSWSSDQFHSGRHSARINIFLSPSYNCWWQSTPPVAVTATTAYTFSGWVRTEEVVNQAFLTLVFLDASGREILTRNSKAVSGSNDWVQIQPAEPIVAPGDAVSVSMRCQLSGSGRVWFDDILLRPETGSFVDLEIDKRTEPIAVKAGEQLTYTIRYQNIGNAAAQDVIITDTLPPNVTLSYATPTTYTQPLSRTLRWDLDDLAEGGLPHTITVVALVDNAAAGGKPMTNTVTMVAKDASPATAQAITLVMSSTEWLVYIPIAMKDYAPPSLDTSTKTVDKATAYLRDSLRYTITLINDGTLESMSATLSDEIPTNSEYVTDSATGGASFANGQIHWSGSLGPGETHTIEFEALVKDSACGSRISNEALIEGQAGRVLVRSATTQVACTVNGGFENEWTGWTHGGQLSRVISQDFPRSGELSARLGNPKHDCANGVPLGSAWMEQTVFVPPTASPKLNFWYRIFTYDKNAALSNTYDSFDVRIDGSLVFRDMNRTDPYKCSNLRDLGWRQKTIDLSDHVGSNIVIRFENWNRSDKWYNTWTYVDDVRVMP